MAGRAGPGALARALISARRFPRAFWVLLSGEAVMHVGLGLFFPYAAIYLTGPIGASATTAGFVLAIWALLSLAGTPLGGVLADRIGRRPVMIVSLTGAGLSSIGFGLASSIWVVAGLVFLWGVFEGAFEPAASAYIADVVEPNLRVEAYGLARIVGNGAFAAGPPLGALVIWLASIRVSLVLAGAAYLVYVVIAWRGLAETRPATAEGAEPPRFREALRDRVLVALALGVGISAFVYVQYDDVLGVFLRDERGYAVTTWGLVFTINPVLVVLLQYPIARWASRRSSRAVLAAGALLQGLALLLLWPFAGLGVLILACVVLALGEMLIAPVSSALAANLSPVRLRASYQGVLNLAWGGAGGPALVIGLWLVGRGSFELMLALALPLSGIAALCFLPLPGKEERPGQERSVPVVEAA